MSELKETKKIKVVALYEQTPKQFEPDPNEQNSPFFAPNTKSMSEGDIENICCSPTSIP